MEVVKEQRVVRIHASFKHCVSILVLMEVVKELSHIDLDTLGGIGFNPCFNGSCKRTWNL